MLWHMGMTQKYDTTVRTKGKLYPHHNLYLLCNKILVMPLLPSYYPVQYYFIQHVNEYFPSIIIMTVKCSHKDVVKPSKITCDLQLIIFSCVLILRK